MNVRVVGVVVVHCRPAEATTDVLFDLPHELAGQFRQLELRAVLRRDDESKLPFLARDALAKFLGAEFLIGPVQPSGRPVALHPVAFEIGEMSRSELSPLPRDGDVLRLDHAAPTQRVRLAHRNAAGLISPAACARAVAGRSRRRPRQSDRERRNARLLDAGPPAHSRAEGRVLVARPRAAHDRPPSSLPPDVGVGSVVAARRVGNTCSVNVRPARACSATFERKPR